MELLGQNMTSGHPPRSLSLPLPVPFRLYSLNDSNNSISQSRAVPKINLAVSSFNATALSHQ